MQYKKIYKTNKLFENYMIIIQNKINIYRKFTTLYKIIHKIKKYKKLQYK